MIGERFPRHGGVLSPHHRHTMAPVLKCVRTLQPAVNPVHLQRSEWSCTLVGKDMAKHEYALLLVDKTVAASG